MKIYLVTHIINARDGGAIRIDRQAYSTYGLALKYLEQNVIQKHRTYSKPSYADAWMDLMDNSDKPSEYIGNLRVERTSSGEIKYLEFQDEEHDYVMAPHECWMIETYNVKTC